MKLDLKKILEPRSNGPEVALLLAEILDVKISGTTLSTDIEHHPDNPSLLSISDVLNTYGITNIAIKYSYDRFSEIPTPFITQFKGIKSDVLFFTVVKKTGNETVDFFDPEKHVWSSLKTDEFVKRCSDVALLAEVSEKAGEMDYLKKRKAEKRKRTENYLIALSIPIIAVVTAILAFIQNGTNAIFPAIFLLLTLSGAITGILLLWYELDQHNPLLQQICSAGKKVNCGAVLHSKAAQINGISWSIIGLTYFLGELLLQLYSGGTTPAVLFTVAWVNVAAIPYIIFSVYYQWRIVKQWCAMCLCVVGVLLLQLTTAILGSWHTLVPFSIFSPQLILSVIVAFTIPFIAIIMLMRALRKAKESGESNISLQKLKHNRQVFESLLKKQKKVTEPVHGLGISVGNPGAAFKLIKVCNPYCGPCARAHTPIEELLHNNPDIQVQLIFTASNKEWDRGALPVKHMLAIAEKNDGSILKQALDDWYLAEDKDYQLFAAKYPMNGELKKQEAKIDTMKEWTVKMDIAYTPTFFVSMPDDGATNYYQLPKLYSVADLKYFLSI